MFNRLSLSHQTKSTLKNYHLHNLKGSNGNSKLAFPQVLDIKVILDKTASEEQSRAHLKTLLVQLDIPNTNWRTRQSAAGNYISFTIEIILKSDEARKQLYSSLKTLPGIKLAL